jgi:chitin disaccharide deacetylase
LAVAAGIGWTTMAVTGAANFAERLGWTGTDVVVILHVDDAGMSHSSNVGAIESVERGVATSWSVMMPCAWVSELGQYLKGHSEVDSGLHLTLTSEWVRYRWGPVAGRAQVPGLVDDEGCLWRSVPQVVLNATADEVEIEIRAQIERAERMGLPITHLDSHMGTLYARPDFFERYAKVGIEKQIPILLPSGKGTYTRVEDGDLARLLEVWVPRIWNAGLPVIDDLHTSSGDWKRGEKVDRLIGLLGSLKPGITEILFHSARPTDEFPLITGSSESRLGDLEALTDPRVRTFIEQRGIILTTWKELMARRRGAAPM